MLVYLFLLIMLLKQDFEQIGFVGKAHGVQGEVSCKLSVDISNILECGEERLFLMLEEQELLIPYAVEQHRSKAGDIDLIRFSGVHTKEAAEELTNRTIWLSKEYLVEDILSEDPFDYTRYVGFTLLNADDKSVVGSIVEIDDTTINTLLYLESPFGEELILPIADELFVGYNDDERLLMLRIPNGLLDDSAEYDVH